MLASFALWTLLISAIDVQVIGPRGSAVGFATVNGFIHRLFGVHMTLYVITDWLGLVPVAVGFGFAIAGLVADGETRIHNCRCVDISYPEFFETLRHITSKH